MKNQLKVWLVKNEMTPDPNDFSAQVSTAGSVSFDDIIDELVAEGTEHKRETLVDIVNRFQRVSSRMVLNGYNVNTGQLYMKPIVTGPFYNQTWNAEKNSLYVSITQGVDLRKAIVETDVEILGEKASLIAIYQVVNMVSKVADGTLAKGRNALIEGARLKIAGEAPEVGIYFINTATSTETKLTADELVTNEPSKLMIFVPASLPAGSYKLKVITQYSGSTLLKTPAQVIFEQELSIS